VYFTSVRIKIVTSPRHPEVPVARLVINRGSAATAAAGSRGRLAEGSRLGLRLELRAEGRLGLLRGAEGRGTLGERGPALGGGGTALGEAEEVAVPGVELTRRALKRFFSVADGPIE